MQGFRDQDDLTGTAFRDRPVQASDVLDAQPAQPIPILAKDVLQLRVASGLLERRGFDTAGVLEYEALFPTQQTEYLEVAG